MKADYVRDSVKHRPAGYAKSADARRWLCRIWPGVEALFTNVRRRDFVFEPIQDIFTLHG